jgi:CPA1 family monovalent cation:H+ antiporter
MLYQVELVMGLLAAVAALGLLAKKLSLPQPILLVIGGLLLGSIPGLPPVRLDSELVFLIFLPPLIYPAALFTSWRDFHNNLRPICLLAVGLVLFTTATVGLLAHIFLPDFPLAAGFLLGAIISPPDAIAATAIAHRLHIPRRIVTVIEGESLVNDATALVAYRFALAAIMTGAFSPWAAVGQFALVGGGGILVGLAVGWVAALIQKPIEDPPIEIALSLLTPFVSYLTAEQVGVSGVLAVVTTGLYHGWRLPELTSSRTRLQAGPVWEMIGFVLNGFIFLLIGLQLPEVLRHLASRPVHDLMVYAAVISLAVIIVRIIWVFPATYLPRLLSPRLRNRDPSPPWPHVALVAWTGMRGVVSLAAALAIPLHTASGFDFPGRDLVLFLTFVVIIVTLVIQGLSLPPLIRWLGIQGDHESEVEERKARLRSNQAALARLDELVNPARPDLVARLRAEYVDRIRELELEAPANAEGGVAQFSSEFEELAREALRVERAMVVRLRNERVIGDEVLRRIQRDIDLAEVRLGPVRQSAPGSAR